MKAGLEQICVESELWLVLEKTPWSKPMNNICKYSAVSHALCFKILAKLIFHSLKQKAQCGWSAARPQQMLFKTEWRSVLGKCLRSSNKMQCSTHAAFFLSATPCASALWPGSALPSPAFIASLPFFDFGLFLTFCDASNQKKKCVMTSSETYDKQRDLIK